MKRYTESHLGRIACLTSLILASVLGCALTAAAQPTEWTRTPASGIGDVAVGPAGTIWVAGQNGTIWSSSDGSNFTRVEASGFSRVSVGPDGSVWGVGFNGTLWRLRSGQWTKTPASGIGDVAVGRDGTVW